MADTGAPAPVLVDPVAAFVTDIIAKLMSGVAAPAIISAAEAAYPWLSLPVIKQIFEAIVKEVAGKISIVMEQGAIRIVFQIEAGTKLAILASSLEALKKAHDSGDTNAISDAEQKAIDQWGAIIRFPGLAPVHK